MLVISYGVCGAHEARNHALSQLGLEESVGQLGPKEEHADLIMHVPSECMLSQKWSIAGKRSYGISENVLILESRLLFADY